MLIWPVQGNSRAPTTSTGFSYELPGDKNEVIYLQDRSFIQHGFHAQLSQALSEDLSTDTETLS